MKPKAFIVAIVLAFGFFAVQVRSDESLADHDTVAGLAAIEPPVEVARPVAPHRTVTLTPSLRASVATDGTLGGAVKFQFAPSRKVSYVLASEGERLPLSADIQATVLLGPAGDGGSSMSSRNGGGASPAGTGGMRAACSGSPSRAAGPTDLPCGSRPTGK